MALVMGMVLVMTTDGSMVLPMATDGLTIDCIP
jgi:hypothetical protein